MTPEAPVARLRSRPKPPPRSRWANTPVTIRYGLPLIALVFAVLWLVEAMHVEPRHLSLVDLQDVAIQRAKLEFFAYDDSGAAASPSTKLGERELVGLGPWEIDSDLAPGEALVRITADGYGVAFCHLPAGGASELCRLGPPVSVEGRILEPDGRPAEGARVQAFGGGPHGVLVGEAVTDADGHFEVGNLSSALAYVHVRVFREGCAVASDDAWFKTDKELVLKLRLTSPVTGRVISAADMRVGGARLLVDRVPGVSTEVALNGYFELDHLPPPPTLTRLLLADLPDHLTHRLTIVSAGDRDVELIVRESAAVEGRVVQGETGEGIAGVAVLHDHGPNGREAVRCDVSGNFRIERVPPGPVVLTAVADFKVPHGKGKSRSVTRTGSREVEVREGETLRGVSIEIH